MPHDASCRELSIAIQSGEDRRAQYESLGLTLADIAPTLHWTTALRVLRDLHVQGWTIHSDDEGLFLRAPGTMLSSDPEVEKEAIRRSFSFARNAQLSQPSSVRFIRGLERRGVHALFAEGAELAARLQTLGPTGVKPELELVEQGARDPGTGLLLQDVWRYARHFWSIPYQSTPGRNMYYLVRDGAGKGRPLIGIAALGNAVLGLGADRLRRLLDGEVGAEVSCHLIDVRLGADASTLRDRSVIAKDGSQSVAARVRELNEELIDGHGAHVEAFRELSGSGPLPRERSESHESATSGDADTLTPSGPKSHGAEAPTFDRPQSRSSHRTSGAEVVQNIVRPRALLGTSPGLYGKPREVWFDPNLPGQTLPNPHISITGETGSGKTQATKAVVSELRRQDIPALILDFKDDYSNESFVTAEGFQLYDASFTSLPLNPLVPAIDKRQDRINPSQHVYQVADIVKRIYRLGDQQAFRLREAIKRAYERAGISLRPGPLPVGKSFPAFELVRSELLDDRANEPLLGRLSPIFDLGLFAGDTEQSNFEEFLDASAVVRLGQLPSDEVKNSVAEFFLMALYNHLIRKPQSHALGRLLILDEAWRVVESPFLTPLMREGRAFGLGVVIASQFPRDLPESVRGSTATRLFFSQGQVEQIREIQRTIVGKTSGPEAEHVASLVRGLTPLSCLMHSTHYTPFVRATITPYFQRRLGVETA